ncbi:MAG: DNA repair protein RadC [Candidatus Cryptobacteroides sp.]
MKLKELCSEERPREKMASKGAGALSNAELLAIVIGSGTQKENVLEVANRLLARSGGRLGTIASMSVQDMTETDGIGPGRSAVITAALELGKRRCLEDPGIERRPVSGPESIWKMMSPLLKGLLHEELWAVFLNRANYPVHKTMLSKGGSSATIMDPKIVVKEAIARHACGIVLVHNHPSGNPKPSGMDIRETENLKKAANLFDIALVDHIIICDDRYFSFADDEVIFPCAGSP